MALSQPVIFNNSTGSNSNSGCGPSSPITASIQVSGTSAQVGSLSGGSITDIQAGHIAYDSTNFSTKFNEIVSVTANPGGPDSITFARSWTVNGSVVIGGKRSTLDDTDSRRLLSTDSFWTNASLQIEATGTDYQLSSGLDIWGYSQIYGHDPASGGAKPRLICNFSNEAWFDSPASGVGNTGGQTLSSTTIKSLRIAAGQNRTVNNGSDVSLTSHASVSINGRSYEDMVFNEDAGYTSDTAVGTESTANAQIVFTNCTIHCRSHSGSTIAAGYWNEDGLNWNFTGCRFVDGSSSGTTVGVYLTSTGSCILSGVLVDGFQYGVIVSGDVVCISSAINGCTVLGFSGASNTSTILGNLLVANTAAFNNVTKGLVSGNGFFGNQSKGTTSDNNDFDFSANPFTDSANGDFTFTSAAQAELSSPTPAYGNAVTNGSPPLNVAPLRSFDMGSGGGLARITMNGGIDG